MNIERQDTDGSNRLAPSKMAKCGKYNERGHPASPGTRRPVPLATDTALVVSAAQKTSQVSGSQVSGAACHLRRGQNSGCPSPVLTKRSGSLASSTRHAARKRHRGGAPRTKTTKAGSDPPTR
ncbi:hypothetical protein CTA2_11616 [Colletotrichum tanaceti]|nr:hypothetical protein CTA2_11616 [Colletotrichum tanaceti]